MLARLATEVVDAFTFSKCSVSPSSTSEDCILCSTCTTENRLLRLYTGHYQLQARHTHAPHAGSCLTSYKQTFRIAKSKGHKQFCKHAAEEISSTRIIGDIILRMLCTIQPVQQALHDDGSSWGSMHTCKKCRGHTMSAQGI